MKPHPLGKTTVEVVVQRQCLSSWIWLRKSWKLWQHCWVTQVKPNSQRWPPNCLPRLFFRILNVALATIGYERMLENRNLHLPCWIRDGKKVLISSRPARQKDVCLCNQDIGIAAEPLVSLHIKAFLKRTLTNHKWSWLKETFGHSSLEMWLQEEQRSKPWWHSIILVGV